MKLADIRRKNLRIANRVRLANAARKRRATMRSRHPQDTSQAVSKGHDCGQTLNPCSPNCRACQREREDIEARLRFRPL